MTARPPRRDFPGPNATAYSLLLVAAVFVFDLSLPLGVAAAVPYTFAVLVALKAKRNWVAPAVAALCGVLTIAKMGLVPERGNTEMWKVVVNRCLALFAISMTTILGVLRRKAEADRRRAEEKLREHLADLAHMGRLKTAGQLAAGLAHELNQPLAAIGLQAEIALRSLKPDDAVVTPLTEITEQSHRAAEIVRGLRRMIRRSDPAREPVDLKEAVESVVRLLEWRSKRADVAVSTEYGEEPLVVMGDRVQLEQVIFNLLENALDAVATEKGSHTVSIRTDRVKDEAVVVSVRDTGPGLSLADGDQVFERFYTTKPTGMGMGLAISRSIVEAHGGRLWAERTEGRGAEFRFTVPAIRGESSGE